MRKTGGLKADICLLKPTGDSAVVPFEYLKDHIPEQL